MSAFSRFRREIDRPGRLELVKSRVASPVVEHPGASVAALAAVAGVLGLGLWIGKLLRRRRFERMPYSNYDFGRLERFRTRKDDYSAVGI